MRRLLLAVALLATASVAVVSVPAVQAQEVAPEPVARALGTQTVGPVALGSATGGTVPWGLDRLDARSGKDGTQLDERMVERPHQPSRGTGQLGDG